MTKLPENEHLPKHVAIIMDGNGRWAKQRGLPRGEGHKQGAKVFKRICEYAADRGIRYVTFYAFSTENWRRPPEEVSGIMDLFREYLREAEEREQENAQKGLRIRYIGEREGLADDILELVDELERGSADKVRTTVNIAINYGGRNEILSACKRLAEQCARGERTPESLTEQDILSPTLICTASSGTNFGSAVMMVLPEPLCGNSSFARSLRYTSSILGITKDSMKRLINVDFPVLTGPTTPT